LPRAKIKSISEIKNIVARLKSKGKSIVFTNGCFDLLHYGHIMFLEKAKDLGDCLIVAINSDASVRKIKGPRRPIVKQFDRLGMIAGLVSVDYVVLFKEDTPLKIIKTIKPDILVKGADWKKDKIVGADFLKQYGGKVFNIKLTQGRSTTDLIRKIVERH
jgi:D-beta-D-heptose 7-phosphate kinase/D-beta-D-heptose 1-phosphate adenosyltransferase